VTYPIFRGKLVSVHILNRLPWIMPIDPAACKPIDDPGLSRSVAEPRRGAQETVVSPRAVKLIPSEWFIDLSPLAKHFPHNPTGSIYS